MAKVRNKQKYKRRQKSGKNGVLHRDLEIIKAIYRYEYLTHYHVENLIFRPKQLTGRTRCQDRLTALEKQKYLWRARLPIVMETGGMPPYYYRINRRAAEMLPSVLGVDKVGWSRNQLKRVPKYEVIRTYDYLTAVELACQVTDNLLVEWLDERTVRSQHQNDYFDYLDAQGKLQRSSVIPDGFYQIYIAQANRSTRYFLEIDLGTEDLATWADKVLKHFAYFNQLYRKRYQANAVRITTVTIDEQRLQKMCDIAKELGIKKLFWFTTFERFLAAPHMILTAPIWNVPALPDLRPLIFNS